MQDRLAHYKKEAEVYRARVNSATMQDNAYYLGYFLGKAQVTSLLLDTALSTTIDENGVRVTKRRKS